MARSRRRTSNKRTKQRSARAQRIRVWAGLLIVGVIAIIGLITYLALQAGGESSASNEEWVEVEADRAPDLPGEFVDLQTIYNGTYGEHGNNATATHVNQQVDYEGDGNSTPPAGGPHWGSVACPDDPDDADLYCGPAPWGIYRKQWEEETLVHNTEHGGVVVWYNTDDDDLIAELEGVVLDHLEDGDIVVMAPYDKMEGDTIALTSWARIDKFSVEDYTPERVDDYIDVHVRRFNPEGF